MSFSRKKITIVGSGFVGSTLAHWLLLEKNLDISLIDVQGDLAKGRALDLLQAAAGAGLDIKIEGGSSFDLAKGSSLVVITAGLPRKPGMSRSDLLKKNADIMKGVCTSLKKVCPDACFIVVSNPLDAMVYLAHQILQVPRERILGMAGVLDTSRFRMFLAEKLQVSPRDISAFVLGGHGDSMVPLLRFTKVSGVPISEFMDEKTLEAIVERTKKGGAEIVSLLKQGSAYYAPSFSVKEMIQCLIYSEKRILPASVLLDGEYGEKGIFIGVPCQFRGGTLEKVVELPLDSKEQALFSKSVASVRKNLEELKKVL